MGTPRQKRTERRNLVARASVVRDVVNAMIENPSVTLTVETMRVWLNLPGEAAQRILGRLVASGVVRDLGRGVYVPQQMFGR